MKIIKPKKLNRGDLIGVIAPSSPINNSEKINNAVKYFEAQGYPVLLGKSVFSERGFLAGDDELRLNDFHSMFANKNVKAIICLRGGYGSIRFIDKINFKLIRSNPKIFVGFSDITTLQLAIFEKAKLITFAGPMISTYFGLDENENFIEEQFWDMITSNKKKRRVVNPNSEKYFVLNKGRAEGRLIGGNLTSLIALSGSGFLPSFDNSILLLEEISEPPYKIDRMFNMLRRQNIIKKAKGIILGRFIDCYEQDSDKKTLTLNEVILDYFANIRKPVIYNVNHGHVNNNITLPIGARCKINTTKGFFEILENVVN